MYRVVIADDEPMILRGLRKLIRWDLFDCEIVGEASSGTALLDTVKQLQPDIVVSDIAMPGMTGIDVLKHIALQGLPSKVIFMSGFQTFSYAKEAITYGAVDYLLKPVTRADLEAAVTKAHSALNPMQASTQSEVQANDLSEVFREINAGYPYDDLYDLFCSMDLNTSHGAFTGVCFVLIPPGEHARGEGDVLEILRFSVFQKITTIIAQENFGFVIRREFDSSSIILVHQISQAEPYIQGVIQKIRDSIFSQFGVALVVGIGETVLRRDDLQQAYNTAHKAAELYYFTKQDTITYATSISEFTQDAAEYHTCYDAFLQSLLTQRDDVVLKLQTLLHVIFKLCYADRKGVENHCIAMAMEIFHELVRYGRLTEDDRAEYEQFVSGMRECSTFDALTVYVVSYFSSLNTRESNRSSADAHDTILAAKAYVQAHYAEDLNLQTVAQKVYMNPYYFSAFFKKETGENFKSFVMRVRMTKALELIQTANLKTYELAQRVGYHDVRTFTENFKEFYGETPSACKKRLR